MIPLNERHLRDLLQHWVGHDNRGRPHASLGPGIPDPPADLLGAQSSGHRIQEGNRVAVTPILEVTGPKESMMMI